MERRKWRRPVTIIEGLDDRDFEIDDLVKKMKNICACGGVMKNNQIILQGDHRDKAKQMLSKLGFSDENIEVT